MRVTFFLLFVLFGFAECALPTVPTHIMKRSLVLPPGPHNRTNYMHAVVEHHPGVVSLKHARGIKSVLCDAQMEILFDTAEHAEECMSHLQNATWVTSTKNLGCHNGTVRRLIGNAHQVGNKIMIPNEAVHPFQPLKNVDLNAKFYHEDFQAMDDDECNQSDVDRCTAKLSTNRPLVGWVGNQDGRELVSTADAKVTCKTCNSKMTPQLTLVISIKDGKLEYLEIDIDGELVTDLELQADISTTTPVVFSNVVHTYDLGSIPLTIGEIPILVGLTVPFGLFGNFQSTSEFSLTSGIVVTDKVKGGIVWNADDNNNGKWTPIQTNQLTDVKKVPTGKIVGSIAALAGISTTFRCTIDGVASLAFAAKPYIQAIVKGDGKNIGGTLTVTAEVDITASKDVQFFGQTISPPSVYGPKTVFKCVHPVFPQEPPSWCSLCGTQPDPNAKCNS